jgi:hypothetical protein
MEKLTYGMIKDGTACKRTSKNKTWIQYSSIRLLKESGQNISEKMESILNDTKLKWYYYKKVVDNNTGSIIVGLHSKYLEGWVYITISQNGDVQDYECIQDAKASL